MRTLLISAVVAVALALVVTLAVQNRALKTQLAAARVERALPRIDDQLPRVESVSTSGEPVVLADSGPGKQVLFYFTTECEYCVASMPYIKAIAARAREQGIPVLGVSPQPAEDLAAFADRFDLSFPLASVPDERTLRLFDFRVSPTLFLVGPTGLRERQLVGQVSSEKEVSDFIAGAVSKEERPPADKE